MAKNTGNAHLLNANFGFLAIVRENKRRFKILRQNGQDKQVFAGKFLILEFNLI